ncbi:arginine decarboxylase, partial [Candidatus Kapabacteria bacterium]|nr:arginine decarboxylase [Candidatus Kapabacteria bacterium]
MKKWTTEDSKALYNLEGWGAEYFDISKEGNVALKLPNSDSTIELKEVIEELSFKDMNPPILLRFPDILEHRVKALSDAFDKASKEFNYNASAYTVYPIKVNQMKPVVEEIVKCSHKYRLGLEAGSKPELHAVLAMVENDDAPIICNGYKDEEFIELALLAKKMGKNIFIVVEKINELKSIIKLSDKLKIEPNIGIRIKLTSSGSGKWEDSGGDK